MSVPPLFTAAMMWYGSIFQIYVMVQEAFMTTLNWRNYFMQLLLAISRN